MYRELVGALHATTAGKDLPPVPPHKRHCLALFILRLCNDTI